MTWPVKRAKGAASAFHSRPLGPDITRAVAVHDVDRPALVLGSTQAESVADHDALAAGGVELVRRRSGGGAVLLRPEGALWVDIDLPAGDLLWDDDVGRSFHWLGRAWAAALADVGVAAATHTGTLICTPWSRLVCFGGMGPGEVAAGERKVIGLAQRRTRHGARFQCAALRRWDADDLLNLLDLGPDERRQAASDLGGRAAGVGDVLDDLLPALLQHLP